ncbi:beta strand repeat-containing protein, partial [Fastidiosibacter lacustris]|uniref:beta strand repeat-containing protein n=1 Tax=Fastidiosibacter lacustris TaxID=2056695 RepID=UPI00195D39F8
VITDDGTNVTVDSDGDGVLDVTGPSGSNYVNNGDGTFTFTTSDGDSVTLPNNNNAIIGSGDDGETVVDLDGDGTVDVTVPDNSQVIDNGDGTITVITADGDSVTLPNNSNAIIGSGDDGETVVDLDGDGTVDVTVPDDSQVIDNGDGTITVITSNGSEVIVPDNSNAVITDDGTNVTVDSDGDGVLDVTGPSGSNYVNNGDGTFTFTTSDGDSVTLPNNSNAIIGSGDDGETVVDLDGDGTVDVTVPDDSQVIDNGDGTITVITSNGSEVIVPDNSNAVITDDGTNVTVDSDGDGVLDVTGPSGSNYVNNGDGTFTFTTSDGDSVTLPNNNNAIIGTGDDGETVVDLDGDGTVDVTVPDGSQVIDNGDGTITVITADGDSVTLPNNNNAIIGSGNDGETVVDLDGDGIADVIVPRGSIIREADTDYLTIETATGDQILAKRNSATNLTVQKINTVLSTDTNALRVSVNAEGNYVINGSLFGFTSGLTSPSTNLVAYEQLYAGFTDGNIANIVHSNFSSGEGTVNNPLFGEINAGQKVVIASILNSDSVEAIVKGLSTAEGNIEIIRLGNRIDIILNVNPNYIGPAELELSVYKDNVLQDVQHIKFAINGQSNLVLDQASSGGLGSRQIEQVDARSTTPLKEEVASSVGKGAKESLISTSLTLLEGQFKQALNAGESVDKLSNIAMNLVRQEIEKGLDVNNNIVIKSTIQQAIEAQLSTKSIG